MVSIKDFSRKFLYFVLGIGRPLEGLILGGTLVLLILGIADYYWEVLAPPTGGVLSKAKLVPYYTAIIIGLIFLAAIYAYALTFISRPPTDPEKLNQRIVWNAVFVLNVFLAASYIEFRYPSFEYSTELILLSLGFIIVFALITVRRPSYHMAEQLALSLQALRKNVKDDQIKEQLIQLRRALEELHEQNVRLFRLYRISHFLLYAPIIGILAGTGFQIANYIQSRVEFPSNILAIVLWAVSLFILAILAYVGIRHRDFITTKGLFEEGLLEEELKELIS